MSRNRFASLIFLLVGVYGIIFSSLLPFGRWNEPGPAVFPFCVSILLFISGLIGIFYSKGESRPFLTKGCETVKRLIPPIQIVLLTGAFIAALERIGFLLSSGMYLFLLFVWVSRYRWWVSIFLSVFLSSGSWYFFQKILAVQLPGGIIM